MAIYKIGDVVKVEEGFEDDKIVKITGVASTDEDGVPLGYTGFYYALEKGKVVKVVMDWIPLVFIKGISHIDPRYAALCPNKDY